MTEAADCVERMIQFKQRNPGAEFDLKPSLFTEPSGSTEQGRGLLIVDELSVRWGWNLEDGGKAVYAILAKEAAR